MHMCKPNNFKYVNYIHLVLILVHRRHLLIKFFKGSVNLFYVLTHFYEHCSLLPVAANWYGIIDVERNLPIIFYDILYRRKLSPRDIK